MNLPLLDTMLSIAVGFGTLIGILVGAYWTFRKWIKRRLKRYTDALEGMAHIPEMRDQLKGVSYYVMPNGGGSLADASKRIELGVKDLNSRFSLMEATSRAMLDTNSDIATFECDDTGQTIELNRTYARWMGVDKRDLLGWGWLNSILPADVDDVREDWLLARQEFREYHKHVRFLTADGKTLTLDVTATPIPGSPPIQRWVGVMRKVSDGQE